METWKEYVSRHQSLVSNSNSENVDLLRELGHALADSAMNFNTIVFTAGNGGSASTADHFTADLSQAKKRTGRSIRSLCLNAHLPLNSAFSNDISYEEALTAQLQNYKSKDHILVVFSASGNSRNIINLLNFATSVGMQTWAFLGFDGGQIIKMKNVKSLIFPDKMRDYGLVENIHLMACHYLIDMTTESLMSQL